ncbi:hypothetical protein O6P43_034119 [Quillaja saponaria]|uniref:Uncharacterized protein n=1 Tax=Quillaja saponaria TaxID=32244 RepID=A0AAD7KTA5_QUISA|nr:hypothetical protein O6P43_034119 [Quillaja saponaria]
MFPNMGLIKTPPSTISESSGSDVPIKCKRSKGIVYRDFPVGCGPHVPCSLKLSDAPIDSQPEKPVQNSTISLEQDIGFGLETTGEAAAGCGSGYETNEFSNQVTKNHCLPPKKNLAFRCFPPECGTEPRQVSIEVSRNANDGLGISSLGNNISVLPLEETVSNVVIENSVWNFNQNLKCLKDQLVKISHE